MIIIIMSMQNSDNSCKIVYQWKTLSTLSILIRFADTVDSAFVFYTVADDDLQLLVSFRDMCLFLVQIWVMFRFRQDNYFMF